MNATVREVTQGMAHCIVTKRATMSVVRASAVAAHVLSVNAPLAGRLTLLLWFSAVLSVMWTVAATSIPPALQHQEYVMNAKIGPQAPTVSTAGLVALAQPCLVVVAVCSASVTVMVTLYEDTVTTRLASVTAHTTLMDHTASPACLVTMETLGTMAHVTGSVRVAQCCSPPLPPPPFLSHLLWGGEVARKGREDFHIACGSSL